MNGKKETVEDFEKCVLEALKDCGVDILGTKAIGVAVSGGADSIALLTALHKILPKTIKPVVITVNHNIRAKEETCADASFVVQYCKTLGVDCVCFEIPRGKVQNLAKERGLGIEEAARTLRYDAFADFAKNYCLKHICLAHNQNDNIETILMRFLTGGDSHALSGIQKTRSIFVRPLLGISRAQIEAYLRSLGVSFCTDSTNFDTSFLRNRLRHKIIPVLEKEVPGFSEALLALAEKMQSDDAALQEQSKAFLLGALDVRHEKEGLSFSKEAFAGLSQAVGRRVLYSLSNMASDGCETVRLPYTFVKRVLAHFSKTKEREENWKENACGIVFFERKNRIFVRKLKKEATEIGFFVIIDANGLYSLLEMQVCVEQKSDGICLIAFEDNEEKGSAFVKGLTFPFLLRTKQQGDVIKTAGGLQKSLAHIFEGWKCEKKQLIPLVQELHSPKTQIVFIWGSLYGAKDVTGMY